MYSYRYINKHEQFGQTSYTLVLEDLDNQSNPAYRIEKCFPMTSDQIDNDFLYQQAKSEILNAIQQNLQNSNDIDKSDSGEE